MHCPLVKAGLTSHTLAPIAMYTSSDSLVPSWPPRPNWIETLLCAGLMLFAPSLQAAEFLAPGFRPIPTGTHALTDAKVIPKPGQSIYLGTVVIRDGLIVAVGKDIPITKEARRW